MQRLIFLFLTFALATPLFGQKFLTADIRAKADSILRSYIGDSIFYYHCEYDTDTYYEYKNKSGKSKWETLNRFKYTKGKFVEVDMRWFLSIPYPQCPSFSHIGGMTSFVLDSVLRPKEKPYLDFIPDFYWSKDSCHLINKNEALQIARQQKLMMAIDTLQANINFDSKSKLFTWKVSQTLWIKKNSLNDDYGEIEMVIIDAITGIVISHKNLQFGPVY